MRAVSRARCNETRPNVQCGEGALRDRYCASAQLQRDHLGPVGTKCGNALRLWLASSFGSEHSLHLSYSPLVGPPVQCRALGSRC